MILGTSQRLAFGMIAALAVAPFALVDGASAQEQSAGNFFTSEPGARATQHNDTPTFYGDVLPILQQNCQVCHQPAGVNLGGMVAPMSFTTYEETRMYSRAIAKAVAEGRMPPWHADPIHRGTFVGERYLEEADRDILIAWAEAGAPAGDVSQVAAREVEAEARPATVDGWSIGKPDVVFAFGEPYLVEDEINDLYIDIPVTIDAEQHPEHRWIKASEIQPGGNVVHHVLAGAFGVIAPGWWPSEYPDGYAVLLPAGPWEQNFQMHYHKQPGAGTAVEDVTKAGAVFYEDGEIIRHVVKTDLLMMRDFVIPAGDPNYSATRDFTFQEDSYILSFNPHSHLRGKAALYELEYPDGRREVLLNVPNYDFDWQTTYTFKEPVLAPKGSKVHYTAWWDNSADNPSNPDHTVDVRYGEPTTDEMANGWMRYTSVVPRHIVVGEPIPEDLLPQNTGRPRSAGHF